MDESQVKPGLPGDRSQAAAEKLRALRERANEALQGHRSRLGEIETQLSERVRQLAEEYGTTLGPAEPLADAPTAEEIAALRLRVEEGDAKHQTFLEQLHAARQQLDELQSRPCNKCQQAAQRLSMADDEIHRLREELETATREHREDRDRHERFVEQLAAARQAITVLQLAAGETSNELRIDLEECRAAKAAVEEQLAAARSDLGAVLGECEAATAQAAALERELVAAHSQTAELAGQAQHRADELAEALEVAATAQAEATAAITQLAASQDETAAARDANVALQRDVASLSEQIETLSNQTVALDRDRGATESQVAALQVQAEELAARLAHSEQACEQERAQAAAAENEKRALEAAVAAHNESAESEQTALNELLTAAEQEMRQLRDALAGSDQDKLQLTLSLSQAESACRDYQRHQGKLENDVEALRAQAAAGTEAPELRKQLDAARSAAAEQAQAIAAAQAAIAESRKELAALRETTVPRDEVAAARRECQEAQAAIKSLQAAATQANAELAAAQAEADALKAELPTRAAQDELQQKCDLALADLQKLKRENSALREQLAERPEASDQQSPELIAVRSERDALVARVSELQAEAAAAAASVVVDNGAEQERDDLQRRFELAVDDVRQLKQENARLREQKAAAEKGTLRPAASAGGGDWASQRARLMALLEQEDESGPVTGERIAERATVASTLAATDQAIAAKDRELAELRAALEAQCGADATTATAAAHDEILDADEMVVAERKRLAELTAEWEAKLRAAELEFSVERAKLARDQAALRDRLITLQSTPTAAAVPGEIVDTSKPRRRWLSALGLGDDADDAKTK